MEIINNNSENSIDKFRNGMKTLKQHIEEYLSTAEISSQEVRKFLQKTKVDDVLLTDYLIARNYDAKSAWDTIRQYGECKFQMYPELFHHKISDATRYLVETHCVGVLKNLDNFGRRIVFSDMSKWDTTKTSLDDFTVATVLAAEVFWRRPEILQNGIISICNAEGFGMAHVAQSSISGVKRMTDIAMYSYPVNMKGLYYFNMPYFFTIVFQIFKPLYPTMIQEMMFPCAYNQVPEDILKIASPDILPTWAGGNLSIEEAAEDIEFYEGHATDNGLM